MKATLRTGIVMIVLTVVAAGLGGWFGVQYGLVHPRNQSNLDELLHHEIDLTPDQERRIRRLESDFAAQRKNFEGQMRAANRDLASGIEASHNYDARASQAVDTFHRAMRALQEATIKHVLAMRAVLTPAQAHEFDLTLHQELTAE